MTDKPVAAGKSSFDLIDREKLFSRLMLTPDTLFLDLASGIGRYSIEAAKRLTGKGEVHAVDLWAEGINALNENIRERHLANIHTVIADITKPLPLADCFYDVCLLATVLHDLSKQGQEAVLKEVERILKPKGILAIVEFKKIDQGPGPPVHLRISEQELKAQISRLGFHCHACDELGQFTYSCLFEKRDN
jgi:ubiquinone/menaquinone biosynthesis C-methylase UbiE